MTVRRLGVADVQGAVALQRACFPAPFPEEFLWQPDHLLHHIRMFPAGQFVAVDDDWVVGSASSCIISEDRWLEHKGWNETVGGPFIENHEPSGLTLYGLDVSVHPDWRGQGVGKALYNARFELVRQMGLSRYGTACRLPGYLAWSGGAVDATVENYAGDVVAGKLTDRTLTPLLRYELKFLGIIHEYMDDEESANAAALLEWKP